LHELLLAEDALGVTGEVDKQVVLHLAQVEVDVAEAGCVGVAVDRERPDSEHPVVPGALGSAQERPQPRS
jgi:hypothetical protein